MARTGETEVGRLICRQQRHVLTCVMVRATQAQFRDQTVLIGVDDMDLFKGIELKLQAVERVLEQHADWRGKLVLVQVTNAPRWART